MRNLLNYVRLFFLLDEISKHPNRNEQEETVQEGTEGIGGVVDQIGLKCNPGQDPDETEDLKKGNVFEKEAFTSLEQIDISYFCTGIFPVQNKPKYRKQS